MLNKKQVLKHVCLELMTSLILLCISISAKASVISYKKDANGLLFKLDKGLMYIAVSKDDIIEVKYITFDSFSKKNFTSDHQLVQYNYRKVPMFPKWAFGLFQLNERYLSQDEILSIEDKYRGNKQNVRRMGRSDIY